MASNILEYTLTLQDKLSAKLQKIGINSNDALNSFTVLEKQANQANSRMKAMGVSVSTLKDKLSLLQRERDLIPQKNILAIRKYNSEIKSLAKNIDKLESINGNRFKSWMSNAFSQIPYSNLITNPIAIAGALGFASVKKGIENEKAEVSLEVLLGDADKASKLIAQIKNYGTKTPYETAGLLDNTKMMLGFGIAQEKIMPNLQMLGDIAMGDANKMQSLTLAFSQMSSTGRLTGQDLLQMINAGFNPLQEMSIKTGKSIATLKKEMEKGLISSNMVAEAFKSATSEGGKFYGMADKMSKTIGGKLSTMKDKLSEALLSLYVMIEPLLIPAVDFLSVVMDNLKGVIENVISFFQTWVQKIKDGNPIISILTGLLLTVVSAFILYNLWLKITSFSLNTLKWSIIKTNLAFLASPIFWVIAGIVALIGVIVYLGYKIEGWGSLWQGVVGFMKYTFLAFVESVKLYFSTMINGILIGIDKIKLAWYKFKEAVGIGDSSENQAAISKINSDVEARQKAIIEGAEKVAENARKAKESLSSIDMRWNSDKSLSDVTKGLKTKLGISTNAKLESSVNANGKTEGVTAGSLSEGTQSISAGGSRSTNITITMKDLVGSIVFNGSLGENKKRLTDEVLEALIRVVNMGQSTVG
jgi:tape measure domain-containing protein